MLSSHLLTDALMQRRHPIDRSYYAAVQTLPTGFGSSEKSPSSKVPWLVTTTLQVLPLAVPLQQVCKMRQGQCRPKYAGPQGSLGRRPLSGSQEAILLSRLLVFSSF